MTFVPPSNQSGYISLPITVDPGQLIQAVFAAVQAKYPTWTPYEGQLDVAIIEEAAQIFSTCAAVATQTPAIIFQWYGLLVGITPEPGTAATIDVTFTMVDDSGYTIPAGQPFTYPLSGNQTLIFTLQSTVTVPEGETTGTGTLVCENPGTFANALPGATWGQYVSFAGISTVVSSVAISGGADPETATSYMNRLSAELQLLTPRPILTSDFAALAPNVAGVFRAVAINGLAPGRTITDATLNATTALVDPLGSFTTLDVGRTVSGTDIFAGTTISAFVSDTQVTMSHVATGSLTGATVTLGDLTSQQRCVTVCGVDDNGDALSSGVETALQAYLEAMREVNFLVFTIAPTYNEIDVTVTCYSQPGISTGAVQSAVETAIANFLATANWGGGLNSPPDWDASNNVIRFSELAYAIQSAGGVLYIPSGDLTFGIHGGTIGQVDVTMTGDAPLPVPNTITVTVNAGS